MPPGVHREWIWKNEPNKGWQGELPLARCPWGHCLESFVRCTVAPARSTAFTSNWASFYVLYRRDGLAWATTAEVWPLRAKDEQTLSNLSERKVLFFNKHTEIAQWCLWVTCQLSSSWFRACPNARRSLMLPAGLPDTHELDKAC